VGFGGDLVEDGVEVVENGVVGEADEVIAAGDQGLGTVFVALGLLVVDWAVEFDGEADGGAAEIEDEWADGVLAAEFEAGETAISEVRPEEFLRGRCLPAEQAGGIDVVAWWLARAHGPSPPLPVRTLTPGCQWTLTPGPSPAHRERGNALMKTLPSPAHRERGSGGEGLLGEGKVLIR
jgi:hypothetical protein